MLNAALETINGAHRKKLFIQLVNAHAQLMADTLNGVGTKQDEALHYHKAKTRLGENFADRMLEVAFVLIHGELGADE